MTLKPETIEKLTRAGLTIICPDPAASPSYRPVFISKIAAGFPSPADDYVERRLDLTTSTAFTTQKPRSSCASAVMTQGEGMGDF
ncbi:hypothetical protein [Acidithiobacillus ferrianus]|uniref:hypothetical protein n=1 Tax=Acidithiobacillus ferrianus TaxID=2678518 RepID=UPI003F73C645